MSKKQEKTKRERLIDAAAELFHQQGPADSSLADIAHKARIPIGNVYYYFKTKDELILAVVEKRRQLLRQAYEALNSSFSDPRQRLIEAVGFFTNVKTEYTRYGCPLGRMVIELGSEHHIAQQSAASVLHEFVDWAAEQFEALGHSDKANQYAISLMAGIEGTAIMAKAYADESVFTNELTRLNTWLEELPNQAINIGKFKHVGKLS